MLEELEKMKMLVPNYVNGEWDILNLLQLSGIICCEPYLKI